MRCAAPIATCFPGLERWPRVSTVSKPNSMELLQSRRSLPSFVRPRTVRCVCRDRSKDTDMADRLPQQDRAGSSGPICLICGAGTIPGAVADAAIARARPVLLVAIRGSADPDMVARYPHHWVGLFELDRMAQLARAGGCRELVLIGSVRRPPISSIRTNWRTLRLLPKIVRAFRAGGDNQLLTAVG